MTDRSGTYCTDRQFVHTVAMQNGMLFLHPEQTSSVSAKITSQYGHGEVDSSSSDLSGFLQANTSSSSSRSYSNSKLLAVHAVVTVKSLLLKQDWYSIKVMNKYTGSEDLQCSHGKKRCIKGIV